MSRFLLCCCVRGQPNFLWACTLSRPYSCSNLFNSEKVSHLPQQLDLLEKYRGLVALGRIKYDDEQIRVVMQLRRLHKDLDGYAPPALSARYLSASERAEGTPHPWWAAPENSEISPDLQALVPAKTHAEEIAALNTPKGLLLTGPPGSGKSFLIDLWLAGVPTPFKARKHYNQLVLEIYRAVWEETQHRMTAVYRTDLASPRAPPTTWSRTVRDRWLDLFRTGGLPTRWIRKPTALFTITPPQHTIAFVVAQRLILRHWLLVFDEIQLLDVSSATLLADVLSWFWRMGGVVLGTSNKVPDDLYKNGVQRDRLEPFVEALKARCPVLTMCSEHDWRVVRADTGSARSWYVYGQEDELHRMLPSLHASELEPCSQELNVFGRNFHIPWSAGGVCKFSFTQLCDESLGPADYISLAAAFHTVVITAIPILRLSAKNQARRFISLIDALYEARCRLVCLSEAQPEALFFPDAAALSNTRHANTDTDVMMAEAVAETQDMYRPNVSAYNAPNMAEAPRAPSAPLALDTLSIFSGKDEQFAFKRALSRLLEMTSERYAVEERWEPLPAASRKWEGVSSTSEATSASHSRSQLHWTLPSHSHMPDGPDFASEAAHVGPMRAQDRPEAPRLNTEHVWGVRDDWGPRAKTWGAGARAYESQSPPRRDGD
ncbi:AFG1-like ATPase-domain-containing protein [Amylocystis lapponica]|nr:AFG1-like ATPase-domain-containing protein [Amylocystis lapponica]